MKYSNHTAWD